MSKGLRTAAMIVGGVALVATGIGAAAGAGLIGVGAGATASVLGVSAGALSSIGAIGGLAAAGLGALAGAPKQSYAGQVTSFKIDPNSGIPYAMGRIYTGGTIVHRDTYGTDQQYFGHIVALSGGGPIQAIEGHYIDRRPVTFSGSNANGTYRDYLHMQQQLGQTPEAAQLSMSEMPNWGSAHKLSGYAASAPRWRFDKNGKKWTNGISEYGAVLLGVRVYDPRLDSTYPGGSGPCRAGVEYTYVYSVDPWLHALTWAIGRFQNGKRVIGIGMALGLINVASFAEAANVADLNGWTVNGVISTQDTKWTNLKLIAQAGGGIVVPGAGKLTAMVNAPKAPLATITADDLADGDSSVPAMMPRRDRPNTVIPKYRSEAHAWEIIPASAIAIADYVTADGGSVTKEIEYPLVTSLNQAAQFAAYDIYNAREAAPITLPLKPAWWGYKVGDCLRVNLPGADHGLVNQDVIVIARSFDPDTSVVTLTLRTETAAKHPAALGRTGAAPVAPTLSDDDPSLVAAPLPADWTAAGLTLTKDGVSVPAILLSGAVGNTQALSVVVDYRVYNPANGPEENWISAGKHDSDLTKLEITSVTPTTRYQISVRYEVRGVVGLRLVLGPVMSGEYDGPPTAWPNVGDPDGTKPADNADVTGDNTSKDTDAVAGRPAGQIVADLNFNADTMLSAMLTVDGFQGLVDARTFVMGQPVGTVLLQEISTRETETGALQSTMNLLGAKSADGSAFILNMSGVQTGDGETIGTVLTQLGSVTADHEQQIDFLFSNVVNQDGAESKAVLRVNQDGAIAGLSLTSDGTIGSITFVADEFKVVDPNGGSPVTPFAITNGEVEMPNVTVGRLKYSALVSLLGGDQNRLDPAGGFQIIPGGLILQWGQVRQTINREQSFQVTWPMAFPNACMARVAIPYISTASNLRDLWLQNVGAATPTGAIFFTQAGTDNEHSLQGFDWIAIGH